MSMKVLQDKSQISKARQDLDEKGASHVDAPVFCEYLDRAYKNSFSFLGKIWTQ